MAQPKRAHRLNLKMADDDRALLDLVSAAVGMDMSHTIRLALREKAHALGIAVPNASAAKKKRRAAP